MITILVAGTTALWPTDDVETFLAEIADPCADP